MSMKEILTKYGEWTWRFVVLAAVVANIWLTQNFVTRAEYDADRNKHQELNSQNAKEHLAIQTSVADIATTLRVMAANQIRIEDHEARIRTVESRQIDVISRLNVVERQLDRLNP